MTNVVGGQVAGLDTRSWGEYRRALKTVLDHGAWVESPQGMRALTAMQVTMRFPMEAGFPMITERNLVGFWRKPIGELCAFINGATTITDLNKFGCDWWSSWTTAEKTSDKGLDPGDIGPGSYGAAFHAFPGPGGILFDQFAALVDQLRARPNLRTHFITPWIPFYQFRDAGLGRKTTVSPCHGWVHVRVIEEQLHLHMFQRSGDLPIGVPSNMIQYAALLLMLSHLTGRSPGCYYHTISDAHIYEDQIPAVETMLAREERPLPFVQLTESGLQVNDIHSFRASDFEVLLYDPNPGLKISVAV
jgi:thymidylate synthase